MVRKFFRSIASIGSWLKTRKRLKDQTPLLQPQEQIHFQSNDEVYQQARHKPLTEREKLGLLTQWNTQQPDETIYQDIADTASEAYAQRMAEKGEIDPRNDAANVSDTFEINQRRRQALKRTIGLNPNRKE